MWEWGVISQLYTKNWLLNEDPKWQQLKPIKVRHKYAKMTTKTKKYKKKAYTKYHYIKYVHEITNKYQKQRQNTAKVYMWLEGHLPMLLPCFTFAPWCNAWDFPPVGSAIFGRGFLFHSSAPFSLPVACVVLDDDISITTLLRTYVFAVKIQLTVFHWHSNLQT